MSIENSINDLIAAIKEQTAAILKVAGGAVNTAGENKVTVKVAEKTALEKKDPPAEKKTDATAKPGAAAQAKTDASSIDYSTVIKPKILAFAKMPEGRDKLTALLARFGVAKGPDLKDDQHAQFDADIDRAMAGEWDPRDAEANEEAAEEDMA